MTATVVLVHGAWHGGWCWDAVASRLSAAGVPCVAPDNPSVHAAPATLHDDADNVRRALDAVDGPVVLVGHSYGGAIITDAGSHDAVRHLVYVTAFALDEGESVMDNALVGGAGAALENAMQFDGDFITLDRDGAIAAFYHDCSAQDAAAAADRIKPQSLAAFGGVPRATAWRQKPSTYVVCTDDRALTRELQQSAAERASTVVEMPTSHSPFLSRPDDVAALLVQLARD